MLSGRQLVKGVEKAFSTGKFSQNKGKENFTFVPIKRFTKGKSISSVLLYQRGIFELLGLEALNLTELENKQSRNSLSRNKDLYKLKLSIEPKDK